MKVLALAAIPAAATPYAALADGAPIRIGFLSTFSGHNADFEAATGRLPSSYAANGYDTAAIPFASGGRRRATPR